MDPISNIPDSLGLYVEEIPTDEYERSDTEQLISCVHFTGDLGRLHSVPFKMVIKEVGALAPFQTCILAFIELRERVPCWTPC